VQASSKQQKKYPKISVSNEPDDEEQIEEDYQQQTFTNPKKKVSGDSHQYRAKPKFQQLASANDVIEENRQKTKEVLQLDHEVESK